MIYQIRSSLPLCDSKYYCTEREDLYKRIADIVRATNEMREALCPEEASKLNWQQPISRIDMEAGLEVTTIDEAIFPEWQDYFGQASDVRDPVIRIENGVKIYPKRREIATPCASNK